MKQIDLSISNKQVKAVTKIQNSRHDIWMKQHACAVLGYTAEAGDKRHDSSSTVNRKRLDEMMLQHSPSKVADDNRGKKENRQ